MPAYQNKGVEVGQGYMVQTVQNIAIEVKEIGLLIGNRLQFHEIEGNSINIEQAIANLTHIVGLFIIKSS